VTPLALLFLLTFLVAVDVRIIAPVLPSIAASLNDTPGAVGLAMTTYSAAYGAGQLVYGPVSDRLGRIGVVRIAGLGFCVFTVLSAAAQTTWQFIAARLLAGAFAGAVLPLTLVFIGDTVPYAKRQAVIGRFSATTSAALAFSASIGGAVAYLVSWRLMLVGYALLALVPVGLMWRLPARSQAEGDASTSVTRFRDLLRDGRARRVYVAVFLEGFLLWGGVTYLGAFAATRHGLNQLAIGLLLALFGVATMCGGLLMGRVRRRLTEAHLAWGGGVLMAAAFWLLIPRWAWPAYALAMLFLGLGVVSLHTTLQLRGTEINPAARGKAFSLFAFGLFSGIGVGTAALGRLVDAGRYDVMFAVVGAGLVAIGVATAAAAPRRGDHPSS
jgi:predicted MFS family arabinose efflux permease